MASLVSPGEFLQIKETPQHDFFKCDYDNLGTNIYLTVDIPSTIGQVSHGDISDTQRAMRPSNADIILTLVIYSLQSRSKYWGKKGFGGASREGFGYYLTYEMPGLDSPPPTRYDVYPLRPSSEQLSSSLNLR